MEKLSQGLLDKISKITHVIFDVDGVMTDGRIIFDDQGHELKFFNVRDGHGMKMLIRSGIEIILLTGRSSQVVDWRARELGIRDVHKGAKNKIEVFEKILKDKGLSEEQIACMGDDIVDIKIMQRSGFSIAPADASEYAKATADYITSKRGGRGAVREVCEMILQAQGKWDEICAHYGMTA